MFVSTHAKPVQQHMVQQYCAYTKPTCLLFTLAVLLPAILLFFAPSVCASPANWHPEFFQYSTKNGLPSSMVFTVLEDREGYIWLGTNHGAVRYDGHTFTTYTTRNGLIDNTVIDIVQDQQGRLWFISLSKKLCYFQNNRIYPFAGNDDLENTLPFRPSKLFVEDNGTVWLTSLQRNELYRYSDDTLQQINWQSSPPFKTTHSRANYYCRRIGHEWMTLTTDQNRSGTTSRKAESAGIIARGNDWYAARLPQTNEGTHFYSRVLRNGTIVAWNNFQLLQFNDDRSISVVNTTPAGTIHTSIEDSNGDLWLLTKNGAFRYRNGRMDNNAPEHILPGTNIVSMLRDRSGNYWFASWDNGLFFIPGLQFRSLRLSGSPADNALIAAKVYDNMVWFQNSKGNIYTLDHNATPRLILNGEQALAPHPESIDFVRDSRGRLWTGQRLHVVTTQYGNRYRAQELQSASAKVLLPLRDGTMAVGTANGLQIFAEDGTCLYPPEGSGHFYVERTNALYEDPDSSIWLGSISGLYRFRNGVIQYEGTHDSLLQNRIVALSRTQGGALILGTRGAGVLIKQGRTVHPINTDSGLTSDIIRSIYVDDNDSTIWIGTNKGLNRITLHSLSPLQYSILSWTVAKGLPSNGINSITYHQGYLWLATDDGLCRFHPDSTERNMLPLPIHITDITVNDIPVKKHAIYDLPWDQNNIAVCFTGIGFRTSEEIRYRYRLLGLGDDTLWHETVNRTIPFLSLRSGTYRFQVSSMNEDGVWNPNPEEILFRIAPHYTETIWFRMAMLVLGILITGTVFWRILESRRKRDAVTAQINELRHQALRANMNPHFISNALSVIQDFVAQNNTLEVNAFLSRFNRLIRLTLETSRNSFVSLAEELERLELYLSLEKVRVGPRLNYRIVVDNRIETQDTPVPSMIIQPYVENAIWHGILPSEHPGTVEINIALADTATYTVEICDNGIGLSEAKRRAHAHPKRKSFSMDLNRNRLHLLSKSLNRNFNISATDRVDPAGRIFGTVVIIQLPLDIPGVDF